MRTMSAMILPALATVISAAAGVEAASATFIA